MKPLADIKFWQQRLEIIVLWCVGTIILVLLLTKLIRFILHILSWKKLLGSKTVNLELTPPAFTTRTSYSNDKLFNVISGLKGTRPITDKALLYSGRPKPYNHIRPLFRYNLG